MTLRRVAVCVALILSAASALAQGRIQFVEYSAKFLCGIVESSAPASGPVRAGIYETSINIHNPQLPIQPLPSVTFVKKVVLAPREGEDPIKPSEFRRAALTADFADHVDCKLIRALLGPQGGGAFIEGFVVLIVLPSPITVPHELDVVGVYTVGNREGQEVDLEVVPVAPRIVPFPTAAGTKLRDKMLEDSKKE